MIRVAIALVVLGLACQPGTARAAGKAAPKDAGGAESAKGSAKTPGMTPEEIEAEARLREMFRSFEVTPPPSYRAFPADILTVMRANLAAERGTLPAPAAEPATGPSPEGGH